MTPETGHLPSSPLRPILITIICVIGIGAVLLSLPAIPRMATVLRESYGAWYVVVWVISLLITVVSLVGYWLMRRWGVYLYVTTFVAGTALGLAAGLPFTLPSVIVPLAISAIGAAYFRRMK